MNLELNAEQLEFLKFIVQDFEYNDSNERAMVEAIESKIYNLQEQDALRLAGILKAQSKQPKAEW